MGTAPNRREGVTQLGVPPEHLVRLRIIDAIDANFRLLIKWGVLGLIAFFAYRSMVVLAGKTTLADIAVRFMADIRMGSTIGYVVGGGGLLYGRNQKRLKERAILNLSPKLVEREMALDPERSSSGLTPRGRTRPEDEI